MLSRFSSCLVLLFLVANPVVAETLQDRKLPSPAVFEVVFPHVVFGSLAPYGRYESVLVLANPENRPVQVELDFRYSDGQSAASLLGKSGAPPLTEALPPSTGPLEEKFYLEIPSHAVRELALPGKDSTLLQKDFNGWAVVRSNSHLFAHQSLRVIDSRNITAEVSYADGYTATTRAQIQITHSKWEPQGEGSGVWWGWNHEETGFAIVNPFTKPASIAVTRKGKSQELEVPPLTKKAFRITELFPTYRDSAYLEADRVLLFEAKTDTAFVILGLDTFTDSDPNGLPDPRPDAPWLSFNLPRRVDIPGGVPFSFPDEIVSEASLGAWQIVLTRLGFVVARSGAAGSEAFPVNFGATQYLGIVADEAKGLAVIYGATDIPVIFAATGHVLRFPVGSYQKPTIRAGDQPGQVVIQFGEMCQIWTHTIDVPTETLISSKSGYGYCPL